MCLFRKRKSYTTKEGYRQVWAPKSTEARANGYAPEHRLKASKMIGRPLRHDEIVHHKDGNKKNNRARNLQIVTRKEHFSIHRKNKKG